MQDTSIHPTDVPDWRQAACRTARKAAFEAAAADDRAAYWQLLHISHLLSPDAVQLPPPPVQQAGQPVS